MDKKQELRFGDMVYGAFPYSDADNEKNRYMFVLADMGENVLVAYCTTNPEWPGSIRLGLIGEGASRKVSNLVLGRFELIVKERLSRYVQKLHAPVPGLGEVIAKAAIGRANRGEFEELSKRVAEQAFYFYQRGKKLSKK